MKFIEAILTRAEEWGRVGFACIPLRALTEFALHVMLMNAPPTLFEYLLHALLTVVNELYFLVDESLIGNAHKNGVLPLLTGSSTSLWRLAEARTFISKILYFEKNHVLSKAIYSVARDNCLAKIKWGSLEKRISYITIHLVNLTKISAHDHLYWLVKWC